MKQHRHRCNISTGPKPYKGPVSYDQNRAAHGGVLFIEICHCGARREVNSNQQHSEFGPWESAPENYETESRRKP